jgi:hypothetical protein
MSDLTRLRRCLAPVAPLLGLGPVRICSDPHQLWHVPSRVWEGATRALALALFLPRFM